MSPEPTERELAKALGVMQRCSECNGRGEVVFPVAVCCGRSDTEECCGEPEFQKETAMCESCDGSGEVEP